MTEVGALAAWRSELGSEAAVFKRGQSQQQPRGRGPRVFLPPACRRREEHPLLLRTSGQVIAHARLARHQHPRSDLPRVPCAV